MKPFTDQLIEAADRLDELGMGAEVASLVRDAKKVIDLRTQVLAGMCNMTRRCMERALDAEARLIVAKRHAFIDMECGDGW